MDILSYNFYNRDTLIVAKELLGKILVRKFNEQILSGRIVETEAYLGFIDLAAHSFKGKTSSNKSLFTTAGNIYIHSMHRQNCFDVVTENENTPNSVLIRALEPLEGIEFMKKQRNRISLKDLTSGPGKLCQALKIDKLLNGKSLLDKSELYITEDHFLVEEIIITKRVGISKDKEREFRFYIKDNEYISKK